MMPTPPDPRKTMTIKPPAGAVIWSVWRVISKNRSAGINGSRERCTTEPGPEDEGRVRDAWPIAEWSTAKVLAQWGPGKYRVDWYDAKGERMKEFGAIFDVAEQAPKGARGPKLRPRAIMNEPAAPEAPAAVERVAQAVGSGSQIGLVELLALLQQREDAAEQRAQRGSDRFLELMVRMQEQQTNLLARMSDRPSASADPELLRREMSQTIREQMFALRQELVRQAPDDDDDPDDDPEGDNGPQDFGEAGERIAMRFMKELEGMAPEALPKVIEFINRKIAGGAVVTPPPSNGRAHGS